MQLVTSHFSTTMQEYISCGYVTVFQKSEILGLHQAKKTSKEFAETTKIKFRTVQRIIKTRRIVLNHHLWGRNMVRKNYDWMIVIMVIGCSTFFLIITHFKCQYSQWHSAAVIINLYLSVILYKMKNTSIYWVILESITQRHKHRKLWCLPGSVLTLLWLFWLAGVKCVYMWSP